MASTLTLSPAQQRALLDAEDTPHGLRLNPQVRTGVAVALIRRQMCTYLTTPPGVETDPDGEDETPYGHWLSPEGTRRRAELLATPPAPTAPARDECAAHSKNQPCPTACTWTLKWKVDPLKPHLRGGVRSTQVCDQHLVELMRRHTPEAKDQAVVVLPYH